MTVLGVIPARGGSKGIPRKNIAHLKGKPLIAYTIESARQAGSLADLIVSTDDEEIAATALTYGAAVPFRRPQEMATDLATSAPVVKHAVLEMEALKSSRYDFVMMLQPTCPLRTPDDIESAIRIAVETSADSVVSVVEVAGYHPFRMKRIVGRNQLINYIDQGFEDMRPRQMLPPAYIRNGAIYLIRRNVLVEEEVLVGKDCRAYIMPALRSINIDSRLDFLMAEALLQQGDPNRDQNA